MKTNFLILVCITLLSCKSSKKVETVNSSSLIEAVVTDTMSISDEVEVLDEENVEFEEDEGILEGRLLDASIKGTPRLCVKDTTGRVAYFCILNDFQFEPAHWIPLAGGEYFNKLVRVHWKKSQISLKDEFVKDVVAVTKFELIHDSQVPNNAFSNAMKDSISGYEEVCLEKLNACTFLPKGLFDYKGNLSSMVISATYVSIDSTAEINLYHQRFVDDQLEREETTAEDEFLFAKKQILEDMFSLDSSLFTGDSYLLIAEKKDEGQCTIKKWIFRKGTVVSLTMKYKSQYKELYKNIMPVIVTNFRFKY